MQGEVVFSYKLASLLIIPLLLVSACHQVNSGVPNSSPTADGGMLRGSIISKVHQYHKQYKTYPFTIADFEKKGLFPYTFKYGDSPKVSILIDRKVLTKYELKLEQKDGKSLIIINYIVGGQSFSDEYQSYSFNDL